MAGAQSRDNLLGWCGEGLDLVQAGELAGAANCELGDFVASAQAAGVELWFPLKTPVDWEPLPLTGGGIDEAPDPPDSAFAVLAHGPDVACLVRGIVAHVTSVRSGRIFYDFGHLHSEGWSGELDEPQVVALDELHIERRRLGNVLEVANSRELRPSQSSAQKMAEPTVRADARRDSLLIAVLAQALAGVSDHAWRKPDGINASKVARAVLDRFPQVRGRGWTEDTFSRRIRESLKALDQERLADTSEE